MAWPTDKGNLYVGSATSPNMRFRLEAGDTIDSAPAFLAPNLIRSEALSLLLASVRGGELTEGDALQRHERLTELKMRLLGDRVSRRTAWKIAIERGWDATFAAEYLAVTKLQADALVTIDEELAAKAVGVVPTAPLEALSSVPLR